MCAIRCQLGAHLSLGLHPKGLQLRPLHFHQLRLPHRFLNAHLGIPPHRLLIALLIDHPQTLLPLKSTQLLLDQSGTPRNLLYRKLPKNWHFFVVLERVSDGDLHIDRMVEVRLALLEIYVENFAFSIEVGLPLGVKFLSERLSRQAEIRDAEFLSFFDDLLLGGVLLVVDLFGKEPALV